MHSPTFQALRDFDNQHDFERMCAAVLSAQGYVNVVLIAPRGGSDGGQDIRYATPDGRKGLACVTLRKDVATKFKEDMDQRSDGEFDEYRFYCNDYLTAPQKDKFMAYCREALKADLILQDIEALRAMLDSGGPFESIRSEFLRLVVREDRRPTLYDQWLRYKGKFVLLEPLHFSGDPLNDSFHKFRIEDVSDVRVQFMKESNDQKVNLPLGCLSPPWDSDSHGGIRATIEKGTLYFDEGKERWRYRS